MAITEEQKELRKRHLCASDAAPALGLSPYKSPVELWLEKRGEVTEDESIADFLPVQIGNACERPILEFAIQKLGLTPAYNAYSQMHVHDNGVLAANFDALAFEGSDWKAPSLPVEAKYAERREEWGPEQDGIDGIPQQYAVQMLTQIAVIGAPKGYLAAYLPGRYREVRIYECVPPAGMVLALEQKLCEWWFQHVVKGARPDQAEPCTLEVLARRIRVPGKAAEVDPGLLSVFIEQDAKAKRYEAEAKQSKAKLLESIGDAEIATVGGVPVFTYTEQNGQRRVDLDVLQRDHPEIYGLLVTQPRHRVCRFKPAAKEIAAAASEIGGVA